MEESTLRSGTIRNLTKLTKAELTKLTKFFEEAKKNLANAYKCYEGTYNLRSNVKCPRYTAGETVLKKTFDLSDKDKGFCKKPGHMFGPCVVKKFLVPIHTHWKTLRTNALEFSSRINCRKCTLFLHI